MYKNISNSLLWRKFKKNNYNRILKKRISIWVQERDVFIQFIFLAKLEPLVKKVLSECDKITNTKRLYSDSEESDSSSEEETNVKSNDELGLEDHILYNLLKKINKISNQFIAPLYRGVCWTSLLISKLTYTVLVTMIRTYDRLAIDSVYNYHKNVGNISSSTELQNLQRQMDVDIPRCHSYHPLLRTHEGQEKLKRVIRIWCNINPGLAYWQGKQIYPSL